MRIPGARHWTESVDVITVTPGTGPNAGLNTAKVTKSGVRASVQPASNAVALRHGITSEHPIFWLRYADAPPSGNDLIRWRSKYYRVIEISEGLDIDTQLIMSLTNTPPDTVDEGDDE